MKKGMFLVLSVKMVNDKCDHKREDRWELSDDLFDDVYFCCIVITSWEWMKIDIKIKSFVFHWSKYLTYILLCLHLGNIQ